MTQAPTTEDRPLCRHAQCAGYSDGCLVADLAWSERDRLIAIARHRVASSAEAEDVVSEAMTRALECPDVDPTRAAAWLTAVTIRLCIDHGRDRARAPKRWQYAAQTYPTHEFEADVIDTLSAAAIAPLLDDMPEHQRRALHLRADGESVAAIATAMSLSEKAVESLLGRARAAARSIVAGLGSAAAMTLGWARQYEPTETPGVVSTAMALAVTTIAAVHFVAPGHVSARPSAMPGRTAVVVPHAMAPVRLRRVVETVDPVVAGTALVGSHTSSDSGNAAGRPGRDVALGAAKVRDDGSGRERPDESFVDSIRACITEGIEVSTTYVGCRSAKPHQR